MRTQRAVKTAEYVRAQTKELAHLSREAGLDSLAYLLEVAEREADTRITTKNRAGVFTSAH